MVVGGRNVHNAAIPPPTATSGAIAPFIRRVYNENDIARITFIRRARELGFSLDEVRGLLALAEGNSGACEKVQSIALRHLDAIAAKISDLTTMQTVLAALVTRCAQDDDAACLRIPTKPAMHSDLKPATYSDFIPATVPI